MHSCGFGFKSLNKHNSSHDLSEAGQHGHRSEPVLEPELVGCLALVVFQLKEEEPGLL